MSRFALQLCLFSSKGKTVAYKRVEKKTKQKRFNICQLQQRASIGTLVTIVNLPPLWFRNISCYEGLLPFGGNWVIVEYYRYPVQFLISKWDALPTWGWAVFHCVVLRKSWENYLVFSLTFVVYSSMIFTCHSIFSLSLPLSLVVKMPLVLSVSRSQLPPTCFTSDRWVSHASRALDVSRVRQVWPFHSWVRRLGLRCGPMGNILLRQAAVLWTRQWRGMPSVIRLVMDVEKENWTKWQPTVIIFEQNLLIIRMTCL